MAEPLSSLPPARNPRGRSVLLSVRVPPEIPHAISEVVESDQTPYETLSDFVRAAIQDHLIKIKKSSSDTDSPLLSPVLALLKQWSRQTYQMRVHELLLETMADVARELEYFLDHDNLQRALANLESTCDDLLNLQDDFWRRCCLEELFKFEATGRCLEAAGDHIDARTTQAHKAWLLTQR